MEGGGGGWREEKGEGSVRVRGVRRGAKVSKMECEQTGKGKYEDKGKIQWKARRG